MNPLKNLRYGLGLLRSDSRSETIIAVALIVLVLVRIAQVVLKVKSKPGVMAR